MSLILTRHADWRIYDRDIADDDFAAALAGRRIVLQDGSALLYDRHSHVTIAVESGDVIATVYRMKKHVMKQRYSR